MAAATAINAAQREFGIDRHLGAAQERIEREFASLRREPGGTIADAVDEPGEY